MKKKSNRGKRSGLAGFYDSYSLQQPGTANAGNIALKTVVDALVGVPVGVLIGGATGLWSLPFGLLLIAGGHHFKEKSGIARIVGASAIAYGVAKNIDFKTASKQAQINGIGGLAGATQGVKDRMQMVKTDLMAAYFLDRLFKKNDSGTTSTKLAVFDDDDDDTSIGAIDVSALDFFEDFNQQEADEFEQQNSLEYQQPSYQPYFDSTDSLSPDASFSMMDDDEPDMSEI